MSKFVDEKLIFTTNWVKLKNFKNDKSDGGGGGGVGVGGGESSVVTAGHHL